MVIRIVVAVATLGLALSGCSVSGETCGLGRCWNSSTCTTLFNGTFTSKAAAPGTDIDHNYWCLGACASGIKCSTQSPNAPQQCMEDPTDDTVNVCATNIVSMKLSCPTTLGVTVNGSCVTGTMISCQVGSSPPCPGGQVCDVGPFISSTVIGPIVVAFNGPLSPLSIDLSSLAHTSEANPPLLTTLPLGVVPQINVPSSCSN